MIEMAHPLVGRDRELNALDCLLRETCGGASCFVVVSGEPGIGKTSLVAELARRGEAAGCLVLQGSATEFERDFPFGPIVDALDAYLGSLDARSFDRLAAEELGELALVFPALRSLRPASSLPSTAAERFRTHHAMRELIERIAAPRPLVLTLDDVQWSDGASLEFIGHLLRRPPDAAVMLAATIRSGRSPARITAAIQDAVRAGKVKQLELGPLLGQRHQPVLRRGIDRRHPGARSRCPLDEHAREVSGVGPDLDHRLRPDGIEARQHHLGVVRHRRPPAQRVVDVGVEVDAGSVHAHRAGVYRRASFGLTYSSSAIRGASRPKIHTASTHTPM